MFRFYTFLILCLFGLLGGHTLRAQLNTGDIMFVGFVHDGNGAAMNGGNCEDGFAFAALVDIPANTTIYFTEDEYNGTAFETGEGDISWTNTAVTPAGTVVQIVTHDEPGADNTCGSISASVGTIQFVGAANWALAQSGEEVYAYLGSLRMPSTWLAAYLTDNSDGSNTIPSELIGFVLDFTSVNQDADVGIYTGGLDCANRDACLASILNLNNWTLEDDPGADCCDGDGISYPGDLPTGFFQCTGLMVTAAVTSNYNGQDISCNGAADGEVTATATGGALPYTFSWSNGQTTAIATGLVAGTYMVTATDADGCEGTASVTVTEPSALEVSLSSTADTGGNVGTASASASGGTSPYIYQWSNGQTGNFIFGLAGGDYSVTVTDANDCTTSGTITVEGCSQPVINSVNIINCNGNNLTLEVDGELNGAAMWQWTVTPNGDCATDGGVNGSTVVFTLPPGDPIGDATHYVRAVGGCLDMPVCFAYVVNDLLADLFDVSFVPSVTTFTLGTSVGGIMGGSPTGGVYSGPGVTDSGNGLSFSFNPDAAGVGTHTITYTITNANGCSGSATAEVVVEMPMITNDMCDSATDINTLFGQAENEPQTSELFNNVGYTADGDPDFGNECFFDGDGFQNTLWLSFTGDGNQYNLRSVQCNATDYIDGADTQIAIYTGTCDNLTAVACGEDEDAAAQIYNINIDFQTEAGVTYLVAMDGYDGVDGEFCLEVTNLGAPTSMVTFQVDMSATTVAPEGVFIAGEFNGWPDPGTPMTEGTDNIWTVTLELPVNDTYEYKFQNGPGGWENIDESFGDPCTLGDFGNRFVEVGETDSTQDLVCFNYCVTCDIVSVTNIQQTNIRIFPNPTSSELYLEGLDAERVDVFSNTGQLVRSMARPGNRLDLSSLPAGIYMLRLEGKTSVYSARVVKE